MMYKYRIRAIALPSSVKFHQGSCVSIFHLHALMNSVKPAEKSADAG